MTAMLIHSKYTSVNRPDVMLGNSKKKYVSLQISRNGIKILLFIP